MNHGDGSGWPPRFMLELERAQGLVTRAIFGLSGDFDPEAEIEPAARAIEAALAAIYDAFDARGDRVDGVRRAQGALDEAIAGLTAGGAAAAIVTAGQTLERAQAHLAAAQDALSARPERAPHEARAELLASGDLPRLHQLARPSLLPRLVVPRPLPPVPPAPLPPPRPTSFEALRASVAALEKRAEARLAPKSKPEALPEPKAAASRAGFAAELPRRLSESDFIADRTRELLEEVAMVGLQRAPLLGDPWRLALGLEQRMFRAIDAIAAMGPRALGAVEGLMRDAPVKDGTRVFAAAMVLGCFSGRDALAAAERVFFDTAMVDEGAGGYLAAALKLVPHDLLPLSLRSLLLDGDPRHRALAVDVLGHRGLASEEELIRAAADEPEVAAQALSYLAIRRSPALPDLVCQALAKDDPELRYAALAARCTSGELGAGQLLRASLDADPRLALLLALSGDDRDAQLLVERMTAAPPSGELVFALGWTGHPGVVAPLLSLLEGDDPRIALAAAYALERVTGAGLSEEAEIEAEVIEVQEPPEPDLGEPTPPRLIRLTSDPRDLPPEPAGETVERPSIDAARWQAWWREHGERFRPGARYRRGRPYTPLVSLWEIDEGPCTPGERRHLQRELVIRTGGFIRFDPHDFVVTQEEALRAWAPLAQKAASQPGTWHRPLPRNQPERSRP